MRADVQIAVLTTTRRRAVAEITLRELDVRGGGDQFSRKGIYCGTMGPAYGQPATRDGWSLHTWPGPLGQVNDFRQLLSRLDPSSPVVFLEDDIQPCRNALIRIAQTPVPSDCAFLAFYDSGVAGVGAFFTGPDPGVYKRPSLGVFYGTQAVRIEAHVIRDLLTFPCNQGHAPGSDFWLAHYAAGRGLKLAVHSPSLVQHVGLDSECASGSRLAGVRQPTMRFPGEDWDAMGPLIRCDWAGPATERPEITWCAFHGIHHPDPLGCPSVS